MNQQNYADYPFVNHLANHTEKLAAKGHRVRKKLHRRLVELQRLTQLARSALIGLLPNEVLNELSVINCSAYHITLSVSDTTTANHLTYLQEICLMHLRDFEEFKDIQKLKIITTPNLMQNYLNAQSSQPSQHKANFKSFDEFSENSKQTITQAIENVTPDSELGIALKKLFNQE